MKTSYLKVQKTGSNTMLLWSLDVAEEHFIPKVGEQISTVVLNLKIVFLFFSAYTLPGKSVRENFNTDPNIVIGSRKIGENEIIVIPI